MNINYITIIPKSQYSALYFLDNSKEAHLKKIDKLEEFILDLIGQHHYPVINKLLYSFQSFFIDIKNQQITELQPDNKKEFDLYRKEMNKKLNNIKNLIPKKEIFKNLGNKSIFPKFS